MLVMVVCGFVLVSWQPAGAWRYGPYFGPRPYIGQWNSFPWAAVPSLPYGPRAPLPPGSPYSYRDPGDGATYCLSERTGLYFVCGVSSAPTSPYPYPVEPASVMPPPPNYGFQPPSPPSGMVLFRLPPGTDVAVDGVPIGLTEGVGGTSVSPGQHQIRLETAGQKTDYILLVKPHNIFTVTPTAIIPTEP
jgi:hypothetical protein